MLIVFFFLLSTPHSAVESAPWSVSRRSDVAVRTLRLKQRPRRHLSLQPPLQAPLAPTCAQRGELRGGPLAAPAVALLRAADPLQ